MHQGSSSVALEICSRPDNLEQASANQNPQAISSMPPALLNKIILDHSVFIALCITDGRGEELQQKPYGPPSLTIYYLASYRKFAKIWLGVQ